MIVNLTKGQQADIDDSVTMVKIGLGWDINSEKDGASFDLDASAFMLGADGKVHNQKDFVYYNNLKGRNESVIHSGDNRTGEGDGDDECILIDFVKIPDDIDKIAITITLYDADMKRQNFGFVNNSFVRVVNINSIFDLDGKEIIHYDIGKNFSMETALVVGELCRVGNSWVFNALADGYQNGIEDVCEFYGVHGVNFK